MLDNSIHTNSCPASDTTVSTDIQALYCNHHDWLQVWLQRRLRNAVDASDLAHDTFVRVLVSGRVPNAGQSRAFLTQIAKGLVVDLYRRRAIEEAYLTALAQLPENLAPSAEERVLALQVLLLLDTALGDLPSRVREVFLLSRLDGLTYSDIAQRQGISIATVRKYMLRAAQACHIVLNSPAGIIP